VSVLLDYFMREGFTPMPIISEGPSDSLALRCLSAPVPRITGGLSTQILGRLHSLFSFNNFPEGII